MQVLNELTAVPVTTLGVETDQLLTQTISLGDGFSKMRHLVSFVDQARIAEDTCHSLKSGITARAEMLRDLPVGEDARAHAERYRRIKSHELKIEPLQAEVEAWLARHTDWQPEQGNELDFGPEWKRRVQAEYLHYRVFGTHTDPLGQVDSLLSELAESAGRAADMPQIELAASYFAWRKVFWDNCRPEAIPAGFAQPPAVELSAAALQQCHRRLIEERILMRLDALVSELHIQSSARGTPPETVDGKAILAALVDSVQRPLVRRLLDIALDNDLLEIVFFETQNLNFMADYPLMLTIAGGHVVRGFCSPLQVAGINAGVQDVRTADIVLEELLHAALLRLYGRLTPYLSADDPRKALLEAALRADRNTPEFSLLKGDYSDKQLAAELPVKALRLTAFNAEGQVPERHRLRVEDFLEVVVAPDCDAFRREGQLKPLERERPGIRQFAERLGLTCF